MDWSERTLQAMHRCTCCPRRCGANRLKGQIGLCGAGLAPAVLRAAPHFDEEPCISGTRGSGAVFFGGCSLRCNFCQNRSISHNRYPEGLSLIDFCDTVSQLLKTGVHNLNLVTGTHYAHQIKDMLLHIKPDVPVIWNCSGYETGETVHLLADVVNVWMPDMKFATDSTGARFTAVSDYATVARRALSRMAELAPETVFNGEGILQKGILVRHLCLPGLTGQTKAVLDFIAETMGHDTYVSLMHQFVPQPGSDKPLNRRLSDREYERVSQYMLNLGLENGYLQGADAAISEYTPSFDGTGVK